MGWKNVKDHYRIGHHVAFHEGEGLCIGSGYVHAIIIIDPDKKTVTAGTLGFGGNDELQRYWDEIHDDLPLLWSLIEDADTFKRDLPVYSYDGANITNHLCEEYGWPNITHDGQMMYDNMFFRSRNDAKKAAISNASAGVESLKNIVAQGEAKLREQQSLLTQYQANLKALKCAH